MFGSPEQTESYVPESKKSYILNWLLIKLLSYLIY